MFEPVRLAYFNDPLRPVKFVLPDEFIAKDDNVAKLIGLPNIEVFILRDYAAVHVYRVHSFGRRFYRSVLPRVDHGLNCGRTLVYSSDARFSLSSLTTPKRNRAHPWEEWERFAGGSALQNPQKNPNAVITRGWDHSFNLSGGTELFIPDRLLQGVVPSSLLQDYTFWQVSFASRYNSSPMNSYECRMNPTA